MSDQPNAVKIGPFIVIGLLVLVIAAAFAYVAGWEFAGTGNKPVLHKETLEYEYVHMTQRSYK